MQWLTGWCAALVAAVVTIAPAAATDAVFTRGPAACHALALTFDLCPVKEGSGFDAPLLRFLEDRHVHATFFASGRWIATHDAQVRDLIAQPFFELGTHGQAHAHLPTLTPAAQQAEIHGPIATLTSQYGLHPTLFRPPYGEFDDESVRAAAADGQTVVMWSVVSGDPDPQLSAAAIVDDVASRVKNGSVIVFHANGRGWHTSEIVSTLYERLIVTKHFSAETVTELRHGCPTTTMKGREGQ